MSDEKLENEESKQDNKKKIDIKSIVMIISLIINFFFAYNTFLLQQENAQLSEPYIIKQSLIGRSGIENTNFPFIIRNPSSIEYAIDLSESKCEFGTDIIYKSIPNETLNNNQRIKILENLGNEIIVNPTSYISSTPLFPRNQTEFSCSGFNIKSAINDVNTFMDVCIKIIGIKDSVCERIPITIVKTRVVMVNNSK